MINKLENRNYSDVIGDIKILVQKVNWNNESKVDIKLYRQLIKVLEYVELEKVRSFRYITSLKKIPGKKGNDGSKT